MAVTAPTAFRGIFRADDDARAVYSEAAGIGRSMPLAVAVPRDADDLVTLVRWAAASRVPLIPRGSGSSMPGGAIGSGVIVDLSRLDRIEALDEARRIIRVGPGTLRDDVDRSARAVGLRFPVDPSSGAFCTIGGMTATNAAGAHSLQFGAMRAWVRALDCIFADGTRAEIRRGSSPPLQLAVIDRALRSAEDVIKPREREHPSVHTGVRKESSGYAVATFAASDELVDLLVGSEGTLAIFAAIELELIPAPGATSSVLGAFRRLEDAVMAAGHAREAGAVACELLDRTFLDVVASGRSGAPPILPTGAECALLAEVEGSSVDVARDSARSIEHIFLESGGIGVRVALDAVTEEALWELRHAASPILARLDPALRSMQFIEDGAVPPENLAAYVRGIRSALERRDTPGVIFGHAGDAHVHVNPLVDVGRHDWRGRVAGLLDDVTSLAASLGGTLAGEHGDGRLRTPLLPRVWSPESLEHFRAIKHAFDPAGILNPGVKVAEPHQVALAEIKYDPALPPLPPRARAALDIVERERAYARFRLELLDGETALPSNALSSRPPPS
jgi:FAD/FMN-containing dehydrogenase